MQDRVALANYVKLRFQKIAETLDRAHGASETGGPGMKACLYYNAHRALDGVSRLARRSRQRFT